MISRIVLVLAMLVTTNAAYADFDKLREGEAYSLGVIIDLHWFGSIVVTEVLEGSVAERIKIQAGDRIESVNNVEQFLDTDSFIKILQDEAASNFGCVLLGLSRGDQTGQAIVTLDAVNVSEQSGERRRLDHTGFERFAVEFVAAISSLNKSYENPARFGSKDMAIRADNLEAAAEALRLVNQDDIAEDLRRAYNGAISAIEQYVNLFRNDDISRKQFDLISAEYTKIFTNAMSELYTLIGFYGQEEKRKQKNN